MLALADDAATGNPSACACGSFPSPAALASSGRRLRLAERWPWADEIIAVARLQAIPVG